MLSQYGDFHPDLIIEATNVCDRACIGCYAANTVVVKNEKIPETAYIDPVVLDFALKDLEYSINTVGIRGGEPTLHPRLFELFSVIKKYANNVFLETHARWLIGQLDERSKSIATACASLGIIVKISFDKMHNTSRHDLELIVSNLNLFKLDFRVAITEASLEEFDQTRKSCGFISDEKIIFQKKARSNSELYLPRHGVIRIDGKQSQTLSSKWTKEINHTVETRTAL